MHALKSEANRLLRQTLQILFLQECACRAFRGSRETPMQAALARDATVPTRSGCPKAEQACQLEQTNLSDNVVNQGEAKKKIRLLNNIQLNFRRRGHSAYQKEIESSSKSSAQAV